MKSSSSVGPTFSVVIPTFNRPETLRRVLDGYERQTDGVDFEVLVVDDGSDRSTGEVLAAHRGNRYILRTFRQENSGPAAARNRALEESRGRLVLFTGDDIEPDAELLVRHAAWHETGSSTDAFLGRIEWSPHLRLTTTMRHIDGPGAEQFSYYYLEDGKNYDFRHFYTSNISCRRELIGDERFSTEFPHAAFEDAELAYRLARRGLEITYRTDAVAYHHHEYNARTFFERQRRCGAMAQLLLESYPELAPLLGAAGLDRRARQFQWPLVGRWLRPRRIDGTSLIERLLDIASDLDSIDVRRPEALLTPLFRLGYLEGLVGRRHPEESDDLLGHELLREVLPATQRFLHESPSLDRESRSRYASELRSY